MKPIILKRRGHELGCYECSPAAPHSIDNFARLNENWLSGKPTKIDPSGLREIAGSSLDLTQSATLYQHVLQHHECDRLLNTDPYASRLSKQFEALGSACNEGNKQEIETVFFDAIEGDKIIAEDLWLKVSWLSFFEGDKSLRFRFSFGVDFEEDVASDKLRQHYAAELAEEIFPESRVITDNKGLNTALCELLNAHSISYVERIVYFNAPEGGAYLHHDRERGHAGVVFAQLTGETVWLALSRTQLVSEIQEFIGKCERAGQPWPSSLSRIMQRELLELSRQSNDLVDALESFANSALIHLINETEAFVQGLIANGHSLHMKPGDLLLLPQESEEYCCWHSVFCAGDQVGQALSFALRPN